MKVAIPSTGKEEPIYPPVTQLEARGRRTRALCASAAGGACTESTKRTAHRGLKMVGADAGRLGAGGRTLPICRIPSTIPRTSSMRSVGSDWLPGTRRSFWWPAESPAL
jgi:hypothetical protein